MWRKHYFLITRATKKNDYEMSQFQKKGTFTSRENVGIFLKTSLKLRRTKISSPWPSLIIGLPIVPLIPTDMLIPKICNAKPD